MNGQELRDLHAAIADSLQESSRLRLIHTVLWLDPIWFDAPVTERKLDVEMWGDDCHDSLDCALRIFRHVQPEFYSDIVHDIRSGATYYDLDSRICNRLRERGLYVDDLESLYFGIPIPAYGIDVYDYYGNGFEYYPVGVQELVDLLVLPVTDEDEEPQSTDCPHAICRALATHLAAHDDAWMHNVGWLMVWLSSSSGNTAFDYTWEHMAEVTPLGWTNDEIDLAVKITKEAEAFMDFVWAGLEVLLANEDLWAALERNITIAREHIGRKIPYVRWSNQLEWPRPGCGPAGTTPANPDRLQLRDVVT
jgi:hypothetical protein